MIEFREGVISIDHCAAWPHPPIFARIEFATDYVRHGTHLSVGLGSVRYRDLPWPRAGLWTRHATHYVSTVTAGSETTLSCSPTPIPSHCLFFACWPIALLLSAPACLILARRAYRAYRVLRARRRIRAVHCPTCNYDLRATPTRCPECGALPPSPP